MQAEKAPSIAPSSAASGDSREFQVPQADQRSLILVFLTALGAMALLLVLNFWIVGQGQRIRKERNEVDNTVAQHRLTNARLERFAAAPREGNDPGASSTTRLEFSKLLDAWRKGHRAVVDSLASEASSDLASAFQSAETAVVAVFETYDRSNFDPAKFSPSKKLVAPTALRAYDQAVEKGLQASRARAEAAEFSFRMVQYLLVAAFLALVGVQGWLAFRPALTRWNENLVEAKKGVAELHRQRLDSEKQSLAAAALLAEHTTSRATERERLEHSRARLIALLECLPDCVAVARSDFKLVYMNRAGRRTAGIGDGNTIAGLSLADLFPSRLRHRLEHDLVPLVARDDSWRGEWTWGHEAGEVSVSLELFVHRNHAGQIDSWLAIAKDQKHQQSLQSAALESEIRLRAMFESALDAILTIDEAGKIIDLNPAAEQVFGVARKEAIEKEFAELFVPHASRKRYRSNLEGYRVVGEGSLLGKRLELTMQRKSGHEFLGELAMQPSILHGKSVFTLYVRDVTERRRAEEKVRQSEERFRQLADVIDEVFFIASADGKEILYVNPGYERIWGRSCQSLYDHPGSWLKAVVADDHPKVKEAFFQKSLASSYCNEFRVIRPDRSVRWVRACYYPIRAATGDVVRIAAVASDITERKEAEQEIVRKNHDLETLLYVTSHDLREPLRAIDNFAQMVNDRYAANLDEKGRDFLNRVVRGAQRLDQLLDDVLTLSRAQRTVQVNEFVDADDIVADVLEMLDARIREKQALVNVIKPLPKLHVDRRWATQAIFNLVVNALKFHKSGEPPEVEIAPYQGPEGAGLVVRDRGTGVAPEHAERIFQLFQRTVGREVEGTGAGLAIVRQIAERHGGKAWHNPRTNGGSEFIITFRENE